MRFYAAMIVVLVAASSTNGVDNAKPMNGYWWNGMNALQKMGFVEGYVEGIARADMLIRLTLNFDEKKLIDSFSKDPVTESLDFYRISYGQFIQGLDVFYEDFRNKGVNINYAILYVRDQVRGMPQAELDRRLDGMRHAAALPQYNDH